jgi:hypothetical protein
MASKSQKSRLFVKRREEKERVGIQKPQIQPGTGQRCKRQKTPTLDILKTQQRQNKYSKPAIADRLFENYLIFASL